MPPTLIASVVPIDGVAAILPNATALNLVETAADVANGNSIALTGREILLLHNTDTVARTVTLTSVADSLGRVADITSYSIPAGVTAVISFLGPMGTAGWRQTNGTLLVQASNAAVKIAAIRVAV